MSICATAQENPLWLRQSSISPDGSTIAFCYKGDIYTVPVSGGDAHQLTTNEAYDTRPVWSPDGSKIAFASDREGNMDIYVMSSKGGAPLRLTTAAQAEQPLSFKDDNTVLYLAYIRPATEDMQFPSNSFKEVYEVPVGGGKPKMVTSWTMENLNVSPDGKAWLFNDKKGYEDEWRKHHTSSITRDIWKYDVASKSFEKLTSFVGEDRNPVWTSDGKSFFYLSEQAGSFNIFKKAVNGGNPQQITHFTTHPVRFLTGAKNGTLCFSYNGELYTLKEGNEPQKLNVRILTDKIEKDVIRQIKRSGATDFAVSPGGKEVAFIIRGDVYVTNVEYNTTKQITDTPEQERNIDFAPDGRSLVYSSERNGVWQIWQSSIVRAAEKEFAYATDLKEENLTNNNVTSFYPQYSPDGKEVAYLENRTTLRIINLKSRAIRTVLGGEFNYSYSDGDQQFAWSPDSKWILSNYIGVGGWNNQDIVLVKADGSVVKNLTESGYSDGNARWVLGGKAMIWGSDRAGYRSHGSWGAEDDVYIMFFDVDAYDRFLMSKEDVARLDELEKAEKEKKEKAEKAQANSKNKKDKKTDEAADKEVKELVLDLENAKDRVVRLTVNSSHLSDAILDKKGEVLYYIASFEGAGDLWKHDLKENKTEIVLKNIGRGALLTDKEMKYIYTMGMGGIVRMEFGKSDKKNISYEAIFNYKPAQERQYMFDHIWRQVNEKFYDPTIRGIDWAGYKANYEKFLPYINNNYDFQDLLSELLGELNGSHTGARYYPSSSALSVASLGLFYDDTFEGNGLKIKEIIPKSNLTKKKNDVTAGCIIEKIDGTPVENNADYLLAGKVGKNILLSIYNPATGKRFEIAIKGISQAAETELLYSRWVERNRKIVETESGGRQIGRAHV